MNPKRILIVGGYGSFGARLVTLLKDDTRLSLIVAGRDLRKAEQFCASLKGVAAILTPQRFVRGRDGEAHLKELAPDLVIDASGPFQAYGKEAGSDPYQLPRAAIACGINYLDLADDAAFVEGIAALDAIARKAQLFVLSGLSTCPALTSAIVRVLASGFARIDEVAGGIAPSPFVDMGRNVLHAIASYAGKPVVLWRDGKKASAPALLSHRCYAIAPPGRGADEAHALFAGRGARSAVDAASGAFTSARMVWRRYPAALSACRHRGAGSSGARRVSPFAVHTCAPDESRAAPYAMGRTSWWHDCRSNRK